MIIFVLETRQDPVYDSECYLCASRRIHTVQTGLVRILIMAHLQTPSSHRYRSGAGSERVPSFLVGECIEMVLAMDVDMLKI